MKKIIAVLLFALSITNAYAHDDFSIAIDAPNFPSVGVEWIVSPFSQRGKVIFNKKRKFSVSSETLDPMTEDCLSNTKVDKTKKEFFCDKDTLKQATSTNYPGDILNRNYLTFSEFYRRLVLDEEALDKANPILHFHYLCMDKRNLNGFGGSIAMWEKDDYFTPGENIKLTCCY